MSDEIITPLPHQYVNSDVKPHPYLGLDVEHNGNFYATRNEKALREQCDLAKKSKFNHDSTRWAIYQNVDMSSRDIGKTVLMAIGPENTIKTVNRPSMPDTQGLRGWQYYFCGFINLDTLEITPS